MTENKFEGYFNYYISKADDAPLLSVLNEQLISFPSFLNSIPDNKYDYAYATGKWTIKEVVFHIIETEIIMHYRAIRISRGDKTPLPGYDENMMIERARISSMSWPELVKLFKRTRETSLFYYSHMNSEELNSTGNFSDLEIDVQSIGYLNAGHLIHHVEVIKSKYL